MCPRSEFNNTLTTLRSRSMLMFAWKGMWYGRNNRVASSVRKWTRFDVMGERTLLSKRMSGPEFGTLRDQNSHRMAEIESLQLA